MACLADMASMETDMWFWAMAEPAILELAWAKQLSRDA
jgi:hypothetical protein